MPPRFSRVTWVVTCAVTASATACGGRDPVSPAAALIGTWDRTVFLGKPMPATFDWGTEDPGSSSTLLYSTMTFHADQSMDWEFQWRDVRPAGESLDPPGAQRGLWETRGDTVLLFPEHLTETPRCACYAIERWILRGPRVMRLVTTNPSWVNDEARKR